MGYDGSAMSAEQQPPAGASPREWASGGAASLYLVGTIHVGIFANATGRIPPETAPLLGLWILGCSVSLLLLAMVELKRGEILFGTIGMVFGGVLGLGGALSFIRGLWMPGIASIDGWWFLSAGIILFLLLSVVGKYSWILFGGISLIAVTLTLLGIGMIGVVAAPGPLLNTAGWLALLFAIFCWYTATAQIMSIVYGRRILPF